MTRDIGQPVPCHAPCEEDVYAEHRAALEATLFAGAAPIVLELDRGALRRVPPTRS